MIVRHAAVKVVAEVNRGRRQDRVHKRPGLSER